MHEALRHHTLLQLKTVGTPPPPGVGLGNSPRDPNTKFRFDGGGGISLRNILAGNRVVRDYAQLANDGENLYSSVSRTVTSQPCPVEQAASLWAAKGPAYLEMFASPVSAVQRLMAELLGAADEFRRLRIGSSSDNDVDDNNDNDLATVRLVIYYTFYTGAKTFQFDSFHLFFLTACLEQHATPNQE